MAPAAWRRQPHEGARANAATNANTARIQAKDSDRPYVKLACWYPGVVRTKVGRAGLRHRPIGVGRGTHPNGNPIVLLPLPCQRLRSGAESGAPDSARPLLRRRDARGPRCGRRLDGCEAAHRPRCRLIPNHCSRVRSVSTLLLAFDLNRARAGAVEGSRADVNSPMFLCAQPSPDGYASCH